MDAIVTLFGIVVLLGLGYILGGFHERRHYKAIRIREFLHRKLPIVTDRTIENPETVKQVMLVMGSAVISIDYFKNFLASLKMIFGGRVHSYESLLDRARLEAVIRMKEAALQAGASAIVNVRVETANIGGQQRENNKGIRCVEAFAYGSMIVRKS